MNGHYRLSENSRCQVSVEPSTPAGMCRAMWSLRMSNEPIEDFISGLRALARGLTEPSVETVEYDDCSTELFVVGLRPLTDEEAARLASLQKQERDDEVALFHRLAAKYEESA